MELPESPAGQSQLPQSRWSRPIQGKQANRLDQNTGTDPVRSAASALSSFPLFVQSERSASCSLAVEEGPDR